MGIDDRPRDDRAWPRESLEISLTIVLAAVGSGVALAFNADGRGILVLVLVVAGFLVVFGSGLAVLVSALRPWLGGGAVPAWLGLLPLLALVGACALGNVFVIRVARANRDA